MRRARAQPPQSLPTYLICICRLLVVLRGLNQQPSYNCRTTPSYCALLQDLRHEGENVKMPLLSHLWSTWRAIPKVRAFLFAVALAIVVVLRVVFVPAGRDDAVSHVYDFIVVGAGTSGSVVAARLSEEASVSVLLLEAGGDGGSTVSDVPMLNTVLFNSALDWGYRTRPDGRSCLGMAGGECLWHRGKVVGGTSAINAIIYNRGHRVDYDFWHSAGNYGWSFEELLPYFKKSEDFRDKVSERDSAFHGEGGPLTVERAKGPTRLSELFFEAAESLGIRVTEDFSGEGQALGVGLRHQTSNSGKRVSSANSFLAGARGRPNLTLLVGVQVQKILVEKRLAKGVLVKREGRTHRFMAKREVILSAGAVASPQLLMLSGIGPHEHLEEVGIDVVADLPVGKNLQCHYGHSEPSFLIDKSVAPNPLFSALNPFNFLSYFYSGSGPLRTVAGLEAVGFYRTGLHNESWPDVQVLMMSAHFGSDGGISSARNFNLNPVQVRNEKSLKTSSISVAVLNCCLNLRWRGTRRSHLRLVSRSPLVYFTQRAVGASGCNPEILVIILTSSPTISRIRMMSRLSSTPCGLPRSGARQSH